MGSGAETKMIGDSAPMRRVKELLERVGPTDLSVLVTGESGTGKEVFARALHGLSSRKKETLHSCGLRRDSCNTHGIRCLVMKKEPSQEHRVVEKDWSEPPMEEPSFWTKSVNLNCLFK